MSTAERDLGSSESAFMRLKVSRHEIPASTRIFVFDVCMTALFPRLPLASTDIDTPICPQDTRSHCGTASTFMVSRDLRAWKYTMHFKLVERSDRLIYPQTYSQ